MQLENEPIHIPSGEWASYPTDGNRPYELFEIYNNTDGTHTAALITWILFDSYLPSKLRWRKRRKFIEARGTAALEDVVQHHFPSARYVDTQEGAIVEFSISLPVDVQPIPAQVETQLLAETDASDFYNQVHNPDSPLNREVRHRLQLASVGTEWQKYFTDGSV
ncbi:MAG TPA: hypothetical protein VIG71_11840 [Enteractinococcus sp.]